MRKHFIYFLVIILITSCSTEFKPPVQRNYQKILILGNSITHSKPDPSIGWYGDWGMAASAQDKDFVHILKQKFALANPNSVLNYKNIADFETSFWNYDYTKFDELANEKHDLLILRIGENVLPEAIKKHDFRDAYKKLIAYFEANNLNIKIICVTSFWDQPEIDALIMQAAKDKNIPTLQLKYLSSDISNTAWGQFPHFGVATHPSDKGMMNIANSIWNKVQE